MQRPDLADIGLPATLSISTAPASNTFEKMAEEYDAEFLHRGGRPNRALRPSRELGMTRSRFLPWLKQLAERKAAKERMEKEEEQKEEEELNRQIGRNRQYMMFAAIREKNLKKKHAALFYAYLVREAERERAERAEAARSSSDTDEFLLLSSPSRAGPSTDGNTTPASSAPELEYRHGVPTVTITSPSLVISEPHPASHSSGLPQSSSHTSTPGGGPPMFRKRSYASVLSGTVTSASSQTKMAATWRDL